MLYRISIILLLSLSFGSISYAETSALIIPVDRFYHWANAAYGTSHAAPISASELRKNLAAIFTPNIVHYLNGKKVATGITDLQNRFSILGKKYASVDVELPYEDTAIDASHKKVAIRYTIKFVSLNNERKTLHAISIFHIENDRISEFDEVSSVQEDHL